MKKGRRTSKLKWEGVWEMGRSLGIGSKSVLHKFRTAQTVSEISVASESRKNTEFYEKPDRRNRTLIFDVQAREVKKIFFGKTRLEDHRKTKLW